MDPKDIRNLVESYQNVYAEQEVSEDMYSTVKGGLEKGAEALKNSPAGGVLKFLVGPVGSNKGKRTATAADQKKNIAKNKQESVEYYNMVLNHLIEEGFASSEENANKIISVMSDEWISSIVEAVGGYEFLEAYGDANPTLPAGHSDYGKPITIGGKPMSMNRREMKSLERLYKLRRENPKEYKKEKDAMVKDYESRN